MIYTMSPINCFTNTTFHVLICLYNHVDKNGVAHVTQREIGQETGLCLSFVNEKIQELVKYSYLVVDKSHRGRYILSAAALSTIQLFKQADEMYNS